MENRYRAAGFGICLAVLLLILSIALVIRRDLARGPELLLVQFPNVGTLILQDPVVMDGVQIGQVREIRYETSSAQVTLEFYHRLDIPADSRIINYNHSLMGSRMIFVEPGVLPQRMDPRLPQQGIFQPGIAEMLYRMEVIFEMVARYERIARDIAGGNGRRPQAGQLYRDQVMALREYSEFAQDILQMEASWAGKIDRLSREVNGLSSQAGRISRDGAVVARETAEALTSLQSALTAVEDGLGQVEMKLALLQDTSGLPGRLIARREVFQSIESLNESLNQFARVLKADGLADIISLWRNVHVVGANPTKKKARTEP